MNIILSDTLLDVPSEMKNRLVYIDISTHKVAQCIGCFHCWIKTPGRCAIQDDAIRVAPLIVSTEALDGSTVDFI